ncbi:MAG: DUF1499 domain-containing protein [Halioglobus sp.]
MKKQYICMPLIAILLFGCTIAPEKPDDGAALSPCGILPNCVNSESDGGGRAVEPLQASTEQWQSLKTWLADQDNWTIIVDKPDFLQAEVTTPLMRFRDDVQLLYKPLSGLIQVRSSSRLGISDMGANRSRVETLRNQLDASAVP